MRMKNVLTRRALAGFGISALAAAVLAGVPTAANALPNIKIDQTVNFGTVAVGSSVDRSLTITNAGNPAEPHDTATQFIAQVFAAPTDSQFTVLTPGCFDATLDGGESCNTIQFRFTPTSSAPAVANVEGFLFYQQDVDPGPGQTFQLVQRSFTVTLVGNVLCGGQTPTILGTNGDDNISGTSGNDVIVSLGGEDVVFADAGNDIVCGGGSDDVLKGNTGRDKLYGETGGDVLKGGKGRDTCIGGPGLDRAKKCERVGSL